MHRVLFIGVGGTGGKTLRFAWREIMRRVEDAGWEEPNMPAAFQFVHFDLPENFDGYKDKDVPHIRSLDKQMYTNLALRPLSYAAYDNALITNGVQRALNGWRPNPAANIPPPYLGAGQRRAVGRAVTIHSLSQIDEAIASAVTDLETGEANDAVQALDRMFSPENEAQTPGHVFVVGSLGGGSGSGMFLDVIERVRAARGGAWLRDVHLVAVAPDAFEGGNASELEGVHPNSFAAICEYLAAFRWEGPMHPYEEHAHAQAGVVGGVGKRTGDHAFFIGGGNGKITFREPSEVYRCVGKALAAYATTPEIQDYFDTVVVNLNGSTAEPGFFFADRGTSVLQPIGSFGFGTVSVGGDLLGRYAAQRLARECVETLLNSDTDSETLAKWVEQRRHDFFDESGLWEMADHDASQSPVGRAVEDLHDQVLDFLRGMSYGALKKDTERVVKNALDVISKDTRPLGKDAARADFSTVFADAQQDYATASEKARSEHAKAWTAMVQKRLVEATINVVSTYGLAVARTLLEQLSTQLDESVQELDRQRAKSIAKEGACATSAAAVYNKVKDRITGIAQEHRDAAVFHQAALCQRLEHHVRHEAVQLLAEAKERLVTPLHGALLAYEKALGRQVDDVTDVGKLVAGWPRDVVPQSLCPSPNEFLLLKTDDFPDLFDGLLVATMASAAVPSLAPKDARSLAVAEIIHGGWPDAQTPGGSVSGPQDLVFTEGTWNSALPFAQRAGRALPASFQFGAGVLDVLERSERWVAHRAGALSEEVKRTIAAHLDPGDPDAAERAGDFVKAFANACNSARPLLAINEEVRNLVHGEPTSVSLTMTELPLTPKHPARAGAEDALIAAGVDPKALRGLFTTNTSARQVDVFGFMTKSVHPVVVDSLMQPVAKAWSAANATTFERAQYNAYRRARTLEMFTPLPPQRQHALVRGWYVAALLGYITGVDGVDGAEAQPQVWTRDGWLAFPSPLLGDPVYLRKDVLPALLESVGLCFLDVNREQTETTKAYARLIELGDGAPTPYVELRRWLESGERPKGEGETPALGARLQERMASGEAQKGDDAAPAANAPALGRCAAALAELAVPVKTYTAVLADEPAPTNFTPDRRWEIASLVLKSLAELTKFISDQEAGLALGEHGEDEGY